jgi:hypothetical protein
LINKKGAREAGWKKLKKVGGANRLIRRRASMGKRIRKGQAWERKKESLRTLVPT